MPFGYYGNIADSTNVIKTGSIGRPLTLAEFDHIDLENKTIIDCAVKFAKVSQLPEPFELYADVMSLTKSSFLPRSLAGGIKGRGFISNILIAFTIAPLLGAGYSQAKCHSALLSD